jgi:hypothetical protein
MAVTFEVPGVTEVVIGGETNPANGLAGPFPRYSISREPLYKDTFLMGNKYTININGTALINSSSSMLVAGDRQNQIHDIIRELLFIQSKSGDLEIAPYGGQANVLKFRDALLTSVEAAEQDETSQGVQSQDYSLTFEAYHMSVNNQDVDNTIEAKVGSTTYAIQDFSETWDYAVEEEYSQIAFQDDTVGKVFRNYTITHTISCTGQVENNADAAYIAAKTYVDAWLGQIGDDPFAASIVDHSRGTPQAIDIRNEISDTNILAYNQINSYNKDILGGTYGVTRSWKASRYAANCTLDFELNEDPTLEYNSVNLTVEIQGYETQAGAETPDKSTSRKYMNAKALLDANFGPASLQAIAQLFYADRFPTATTSLRTAPSAFTQTHSQTGGSITLNATYDDGEVLDGIISETVNVTYTNEDGLTNVVAILPVIAKGDGPVIQNMQTTPERTRSISLEWVMEKDNRELKPDGFTYIEQNYKPIFDDDPAVVYRQNATETWNHKSGAYSANVDYVWTSKQPNPNIPNS